MRSDKHRFNDGIFPTVLSLIGQACRSGVAVLLAAMWLIPAGASAQTGASAYPKQKPVMLVVPYPAGGASDVSARIFSAPIAQALGPQVVVENVGGGTGMLGSKRVLNAPPDGYSMLHGSVNEVILAPLVNAAAQYRSEDFRLTQPITEATIVLLTRADLKVANLDEFIELARKPGPRPLTYGSVGVGSLYHVLTEYMAKRIDAKFLHVPYKGAAPAMQDLAGGHVDFAVLPYQNNMEGLAKQGRINLITSFSKVLPAPLKHIPAVGQSKLLPDFEYVIGGGYYVRKDTPEAVLKVFRGQRPGAARCARAPGSRGPPCHAPGQPARSGCLSGPVAGALSGDGAGPGFHTYVSVDKGRAAPRRATDEDSCESLS